MRVPICSAITAALVAALLFGASTPLAKQLLRHTSPMMLAGLLYLGTHPHYPDIHHQHEHGD